MRYFFILCLFFIGGGAIASENLIENLRIPENTTIDDGVVRQVRADSYTGLYWKLQAWFNNYRDDHQSSGTSVTYLFGGLNNASLGFISRTFTTPDDMDDLLRFRFGLNGQERDTVVSFDIKDVMPNTTYTIQWRLLNNTQGEVAWTDMRVVHCGDGYSLALGDENCSRECENQSVTGGHIPPDVARVYEPEICTYDSARLKCDDGYNKINNACEQICTSGIKRLHAGKTVNGLYQRKLSSPALCIKYNDQTCYGHLTPGRGTGLNVNLDGVVYHLID